jgi:dTDP-4-amino-4,6-dideoxygalactose transaminase
VLQVTKVYSSIPVAKPWLGEQEVQAAARAILSGWITQGPEVAAFEREFAAFVGAPYACAVSNCTTALHLALLAVGVQPGDEVITVSHSFIATANAIRYCGAKPVFIDIDPQTYNIRPELIESAISERTRAILCVHQIGMPCDLNRVIEIGHGRRLPVIEDAACAIGSEVFYEGEWEKIGKPHGDIACFSFHPRKLLTTGDGGMLTTRSEAWDQQFRLWRQHCMSVPDTARHKAREIVYEEYPALGYNYRMTDIQAAVGREQLKRIPEMVSRRRQLVQRYCSLLAENRDIGVPFEPAWARSNWQSFCVSLPEFCDQRRIMQAMLDQGIAVRRGVMCAHREKAYDKSVWSCGPLHDPCDCTLSGCARLAASENAQDHSIILPLFYEMTEADVDRVVAALNVACSRLK